MSASFNGLGMNLGNLARLSNAVTRSISAENFTGEKGKAGMVSMYRYHQFGLGGLPLDIGLRYGSSRIREIRRARHPC